MNEKRKSLIKILLYSLLLVVITIIFFPPFSTQEKFNLSESQKNQLLLEAHQGKLEAIEKLYLFYKFSSNDFNQSLHMLRLGAQTGDQDYQFKLGRYLLYGRNLSEPTNDADRYKEGLFWLKKSASQGNIQAKQILNKLDTKQ